MANYIYKSGELHSNGETVKFPTPESAKGLSVSFPSYNSFVVDEKTTGENPVNVKKQYLIGLDGTSFAVLEIDETKIKLDPKPQCNNLLGK